MAKKLITYRFDFECCINHCKVISNVKDKKNQKFCGIIRSAGTFLFSPNKLIFLLKELFLRRIAFIKNINLPVDFPSLLNKNYSNYQYSLVFYKKSNNNIFLCLG